MSTSCPTVLYCTYTTYGNLGFNPYLSYVMRDNRVTSMVFSMSPTCYDLLHEYYKINFIQENPDLKIFISYFVHFV